MTHPSIPHPMLALLRRLLDPDDLGHAVSAEVRQHARALLADGLRPGAEAMRWIYLAGPMTGVEAFNHPAFAQAQAELQRAGFVCLNPARNGLPLTAPWHHHMRRDLSMLLACDALALLPGWETSRGARLEVQWADRLQMPVRAVGEWVEQKEMAA